MSTVQGAFDIIVTHLTGVYHRGKDCHMCGGRDVAKEVKAIMEQREQARRAEREAWKAEMKALEDLPVLKKRQLYRLEFLREIVKVTQYLDSPSAPPPSLVV